MSECTVWFQPQHRSVRVPAGTTLLEASLKAHISINNLCGGDGICGRCKMIVKQGQILGEVSTKLSREEIQAGFVLACMTTVRGDLVVEVPRETWAKEKIIADKDAERFRAFDQLAQYGDHRLSPLVTKLYIELKQPSLANNQADHQRLCTAIERRLGFGAMQMGLKIIKNLPHILRDADYRVTATIGLRRDIAEIMDLEAGNTQDRNYMAIVDMGTTTIVTHLVDVNSSKTIDAKACFNSQGAYGREVTARMMAAERKGIAELQKLLIDDMNQLISGVAKDNGIHLKDVTAVVCAGNTAMGHFLLGLPTDYIRRSPYIPASVEPPPLRAAEVGIQIHPRGLLYSLPGISGWVGSDLTAGILATQIHQSEELSLLVDMGTNGEIVVGNSEWLVACSASAGPALEGANEECGMRAEQGAIERFRARGGKIQFETIGNVPPKGICGSGIIDLLSVLLSERIIDRSGKFTHHHNGKVSRVDGVNRYILADERESGTRKPIYITESDIESVITAKAAIFAAMRILLQRLDMRFSDIRHFYIAGAFGNYIDIENAIAIGLMPSLERQRIEFVGNTSITGAKIAAFYRDAFHETASIRNDTTYYDLMGAHDYVEEFRKALFLPHTDIQLFGQEKAWQEA